MGTRRQKRVHHMPKGWHNKTPNLRLGSTKMCLFWFFWLLDRQNWVLGFSGKHLYKRTKNSSKRFFWLLNRQNWVLGFSEKHLYKRAKNSSKRFSLLDRQNWVLGFSGKHLYKRAKHSSKRFSLLNRQNWVLGFTAKHLCERENKKKGRKKRDPSERSPSINLQR